MEAKNKFTAEKNAALKAALQEVPFSASDLTEELAPLLNDYFQTILTKQDDKIVMSFPNGQRFVVSVTEN